MPVGVYETLEYTIIGCDQRSKKSVIISFCSVVYDLLLVKVRTVLSGMFAEESSQQYKLTLSDEPEEVYYRFCGAAMAGMYKEKIQDDEIIIM